MKLALYKSKIKIKYLINLISDHYGNAKLVC
jgi:hypothetical protein